MADGNKVHVDLTPSTPSPAEVVMRLKKAMEKRMMSSPHIHALDDAPETAGIGEIVNGEWKQATSISHVLHLLMKVIVHGNITSSSWEWAVLTVPDGLAVRPAKVDFLDLDLAKSKLPQESMLHHNPTVLRLPASLPPCSVPLQKGEEIFFKEEALPMYHSVTFHFKGGFLTWNPGQTVDADIKLPVKIVKPRTEFRNRAVRIVPSALDWRSVKETKFVLLNWEQEQLKGQEHCTERGQARREYVAQKLGKGRKNEGR